MSAIATPIDQVIADIASVIDWSKQHASRLGYFAALYLRVTKTIKGKIGTGFFDDDARMERLDFAFASRYLAIAHAVQAGAGGAVPKAWAVAVQALPEAAPIIVQHLLLAMNPHINIDLAVACAETAPGSQLPALHGDFLKVNAILASLVPTVEQEIGVLSPFIKLLDAVAGNADGDIINFSMDAARDAAWQLAGILAALPADQRQPLIDHANNIFAVLGDRVIDPGKLLDPVITVISSVESKDVLSIINTLDTGDELL
jgi:hypothetical protein